jgi:hypothetical protein
VGDLFKALSSGLARYVYAWLMPGILVSGVFLLVVVPQLPVSQNVGTLGGAAVFALAVLGLSVVFAYASRPMYQFLEGYTMPGWLARPLLRRSRRRFVRLVAARSRGPAIARQQAAEALLGYPDRVELLLPTRLGNALKAMEGYGESRFGLDSQTFWYELQAVADDKVRRSTEETRAAVDFFMSSVAHLGLLSVASASVAPSADRPLVPLAVSIGAAILLPAAYGQAVRNVGEWRYAVQALVNMSRPALAAGLALGLPGSHDAERRMWLGFAGLIHHGPRGEYLRVLDPVRRAETTVPVTRHAEGGLPARSPDA